MEDLLVFKNISKSFNKVNVLIDCSLRVKAGDLIHIKGTNGSGKSTLLKILSGLLESDNGLIEFHKDVNIGALIENPEFAEYSTIKENLVFLAKLKNNYNSTKIENLCNIFNLDFNDKKFIKNFSVGMKQKLGIIQAIMEDQNLIFLDEPTRGLVDSSIKAFEDYINQLISNKKCAVIIASHDMIDGLKYSHYYTLKNGILNEVQD